MANVLNRVTKEFKRSVNEPDFPLVDWIHDPDLSAVVPFRSVYWVITGDAVTLMSLAERDAVDAAAEIVSRDAIAAELIEQKSLIRNLAICLNDELAAHTQRLNALRNAIANANSLADLKASAEAAPVLVVLTSSQLRDNVRAKIGEAE